MTSAEKAQMLLPWYVNGSISYDDEKLVESELAKSSVLRKEYETQRFIAKRVKQDKDILDISVISTQEQRLSKMMARIHNESLSEENGNVRISFFKRLQGVMPDLSRQWVYPAFAFLILVQLGVLIYVVKPDVLSTYSQPAFYYPASVSDAKPSEQMQIVIEFTPQAKKSEIKALLAKVNAEITYHPEGSFSYRVALKDVRDEGHLNQILNALQGQRQLVLFAERSY